jgi:hypothetical protein
MRTRSSGWLRSALLISIAQETAWRLIPGLYYQIRTGKVALFDGSWIASAARKVGSGKYAKWLLFHLHQLPKFAQQNMH